jgi:UDP-N-acetylglucosamine 2-epimerase
MTDGLHVFIGTKAQYIKTAPLLRLLDERGVAYRLIDSGQHAGIAASMRSELGVRRPDFTLGGADDVATIPRALVWSLGLAGRLVRRRRLQAEVFGGMGGICIVHGDTPSTLLAALMARRAGLRVAHLEAGLRSHKLTHPFPEEIIRIVTMRLASLLFAPDGAAVRNLERMRVKGHIVALSGNTSLEAVRFALPDVSEPGGGPVVATMHRVENLHNGSRIEAMITLIERVAAQYPVRFVLHEPTEAALAKRGLGRRLASAGVERVGLAGHGEFVRMLAAAPFVITDGGSIQEECALLGVPTLLWRDRSERPDGIGGNVVVGRYDPEVIDRFLADPEAVRAPMRQPAVSPSEEILAVLLDEPTS